MAVQTVLLLMRWFSVAAVRAVLAVTLIVGLPASAQSAPGTDHTQALWTANVAQPQPERIPSGTKHACCACHSHHIAEPKQVRGASVPMRGSPNEFFLQIIFARGSPQDRPLRPPIG